MSRPRFTPKTFEPLFDEFVRSRAKGTRLDEIYAGSIPNGIKSADYYFPTNDIVVELKTLNQNHGGREFILSLVDEALERFGYPQTRRFAWLTGERPLPKKVVRRVDSRVQNSLRNMVRKANRQILSSQELLGHECDGVLVVANLNEYLFGPIELLRNLAGYALERKESAIDAILLITPGVAYSSSHSEAQHYLAPAYADGKQHLGDFIEPLAEAWIHFEAEVYGVTARIEKVFSLDKKSKDARPLDPN